MADLSSENNPDATEIVDDVTANLETSPLVAASHLLHER